MKPLPSAFAPYLFGGILSFIMVAIVSAMVIIMNQGIDSEFIKRWCVSFFSAWPIAFPTVLIVAPMVKKLVSKLVRPPKNSA